MNPVHRIDQLEMVASAIAARLGWPEPVKALAVPRLMATFVAGQRRNPLRAAAQPTAQWRYPNRVSEIE